MTVAKVKMVLLNKPVFEIPNLTAKNLSNGIIRGL